MISKKNQPSKLSFFYSIGLFIIGMALFFSKLDSKENNVKPVQYTGLICILSSSLSIVVGIITWIRQIPRVDAAMVSANTESNNELIPSSRGLEYKMGMSASNDEDKIKNNFNLLPRKSYSAPITADFYKESFDKKKTQDFKKDVDNATVPARPFSFNN